MRTIDITDTPYAGRTSSIRLALPAQNPCCLRCGSDLRGRYIGNVGGVDVWRCRCGRTRRVKREAGM
jgi:hypothetical protein